MPVSSAVAAASARRPLVVSLAGVLLGLLPATASGEPKLDPHPPRHADPERNGSLVIVGGGGMPDTIRDRFLELAGGKKGKLVVIPTASTAFDRPQNSKSYSYWRQQGLASVSMLHTTDPKQANDPAFIKPLTEATAAWLGGGDQSRLAGAYRGTAVEKELHRLLARGGVVGGTSAGASVMSAVMITGGNPQARIGIGFGLLPDVVIDQHFENRKRQKRLQGVLLQHPRCLGLGIDEMTAVVVHGDTFTVLGDANVVLCMPPLGAHPSRMKVLKSGEAGNLIQLAKSLLAPLKSSAETKSVASKEP
ncbi:MAG TPA: cyanophycinase [Gemmataceae bacterium]|nr:cyanophycinase [Gemmataceae bacterium]